MMEGMGQPGQRLMTATEKVWRVGQGRKIYSLLKRLQCAYFFFEIYKRGL